MRGATARFVLGIWGTQPRWRLPDMTRSEPSGRSVDTVRPIRGGVVESSRSTQTQGADDWPDPEFSFVVRIHPTPVRTGKPFAVPSPDSLLIIFDQDKRPVELWRVGTVTHFDPVVEGGWSWFAETTMADLVMTSTSSGVTTPEPARRRRGPGRACQRVSSPKSSLRSARPTSSPRGPRPG